MTEPTEKLKRAVKTLIDSSTTEIITRVVTPEGHVVVVARAPKQDDPKSIKEVLSRATCASDQHDYAACLYGWYEDHKAR